MALYKHNITNEIRDLDEQFLAQLQSDNNPKAQVWELYVPPEPTPAPVVVPYSVTRRQLKEWLIRNNKLTQVEQVLNGIEDATEKAIANNYWSEATEFERGHPLIASIGGAIGMTSEDIDAAFIAAKVL